MVCEAALDAWIWELATAGADGFMTTLTAGFMGSLGEGKEGSSLHGREFGRHAALALAQPRGAKRRDVAGVRLQEKMGGFVQPLRQRDDISDAKELDLTERE